MIEKDKTTELKRGKSEGYTIEVTVEENIPEHAIYNVSDDEQSAKINIGYNDDDEILEHFEMLLYELLDNYQIEMWVCNNCGNYYWKDFEERAPNCNSCGRSLSKKSD